LLFDHLGVGERGVDLGEGAVEEAELVETWRSTETVGDLRFRAHALIAIECRGTFAT